MWQTELSKQKIRWNEDLGLAGLEVYARCIGTQAFHLMGILKNTREVLESFGEGQYLTEPDDHHE